MEIDSINNAAKSINEETAEQLVRSGNRLDGATRKMISLEAMQASRGQCSACRALHETCLKPGMSLLEELVQVHDKISVRVAIAHAIAALQEKIDLAFYDECVASLEHGAQEMAELSVLVALACSYEVWYRAQGLDVPELPAAWLDECLGLALEEYVTEQSRYLEMGYAPRARGFIEDSLADSILSQEAGLKSSVTSSILPLAHVSLSPFDLVCFQRRNDAFFVSKDFGLFRMPPNRALNRSQAEFVGAEYARLVQCSF